MPIKLKGTPGKETNDLYVKWQNRKDFLDEVGQQFLQEAQLRITGKKTDPMGTKWAPWARSTALARAKDGSAARGLLYKSGDLLNTLSYRVQGDKVSVSSDSPYARYLQNGTSRMPARPFLGMGEKEQLILQQVWQKWINM